MNDDALYNLWARKKDSEGYHHEGLGAIEFLRYEAYYKKEGFKVTWNFSAFGDGTYE